MRVTSALIASLVITPLAVGAASATTVEPEPQGAVTEPIGAATATVQPDNTVTVAPDTAAADPAQPAAVAPEGGDAPTAPATLSADPDPAAADEADTDARQAEASAADATGTDAPGVDATTGAPTVDAAVPTGTAAPTAATVIPENVLITSIAVDATVSPVQQPWNTRGIYHATLTVNDVVGTGSDNLSYAGLVADSAFTLSVNGGSPTTVVPAAEGSVPVTGIVEGANYLVLNVQYANPAAPAVTAAASYYVELTVLTQPETIDLVREDTASTGVNEGTRYQGEQVTVVAPAGTYTPGEVLTVTVYDQNDVAVDTVTAVAAADGSLSVTYSVPMTMTPGDYLLYLSDSAGEPAGSYILHVLERVAETIAPPVDDTGTVTPTDTDTTDQVKTDPAVSTVRSAPLTDRLATTGSESSAALWAAGGLAGAGAVLAGAAATLRRRRSVVS